MDFPTVERELGLEDLRRLLSVRASISPPPHGSMGYEQTEFFSTLCYCLALLTRGSRGEME